MLASRRLMGEPIWMKIPWYGPRDIGPLMPRGTRRLGTMQVPKGRPRSEVAMAGSRSIPMAKGG